MTGQAKAGAAALALVATAPGAAIPAGAAAQPAGPSAPVAASRPQIGAAGEAAARTAAPAAGREPGLAEVEDAAMRTAAGPASDDASRAARLRAAHWAPVLRAQAGLRDDERSRRGQFRLAPLVENDAGTSRAWAVVAQWDLAQLVYSRDEAQLALAHVHLARVRRQAAGEAARLYEERFRQRVFLRLHGDAQTPERADVQLALLRATAGLDALTGGLYRAQLAQAEEQLARLDPGLVSAEAATSAREGGTRRAGPERSLDMFVSPASGAQPRESGAPHDRDRSGASAAPASPDDPTLLDEEDR